jgi:membrane protease YdiL (CAAX protease family)
MTSGTEAIAPGALGVLRRYPLVAYFAIAMAFSWTVVVIAVVTGAPANVLVILPITLGPTFAAFVMTAVVEGRAGIRRLLGRFILWRVPAVWYLFVLFGIPLIFVRGTVFLPGAAASFDPLTPGAWLAYPRWFVLILVVGGPSFEEPGWRGFALARLEAKFGPVAGTLILALLWAAWHYPQYLMPDWAAQNGRFSLSDITVFTLSVVPATFLLS